MFVKPNRLKKELIKKAIENLMQVGLKFGVPVVEEQFPSIPKCSKEPQVVTLAQTVDGIHSTSDIHASDMLCILATF